MKPILILLIILLPITSLRAQDSLFNKHHYTIAWLGFGPQHEYSRRVTCTFLPAIEKRWGQYSGQLQLGMAMPVAYSIQDSIDNLLLKGHMQWYTLRVEARKYKYTRGKAQLYVGAELFANLFKTPRFYTPYNPGGTLLHEDAFVLTKRMVGVGFTSGFQRYVSRHVLLGIHASAGVKFRYITSQHKFDKETYIMHRHDIITEQADKLGFTVAMASYVNISVGYVFR